MPNSGVSGLVQAGDEIRVGGCLSSCWIRSIPRRSFRDASVVVHDALRMVCSRLRSQMLSVQLRMLQRSDASSWLAS